MSVTPSAAHTPQRPLTFSALLRTAPRLPMLAIVAAVISAILSIAPFWLLYLAVQQLLEQGASAQGVWPLLAGALLLFALRWILMALSHVLAHVGAFAIQHQLRLRLARHLGRVPMSFFAKNGSGSLRRTLGDDVNQLEGFLAHMLPDAAAASTVPLVALALLFMADWRLALASLAPLPLAAIAQWWMFRGAGPRMQEWGQLQQGIANQVGEYVRGVHVVKAFGVSARSFADLAASIHGAVAWVADYARSSSAGWVLFTALITANVIVIGPLGAWLLQRGTLDAATWVLFLLVAPAVLQPLLRLTFALGEQIHRGQSLARIDAILKAPVLPETATAQAPDGPWSLCFKRVCFSYDGTATTLQDIDLPVAAGQLVAVVGPSGSGKTTLARLLLRLHDVQAGQVEVANLDVRQWPLDALLSRIAVVFQDVQLFHGSVRDNLLLAAPDADQAALERATRAARAHDFIMALPQGYDTPLGERGVRLSGGERQRLSIARALLKDAPILLLDEATSYADAENEAQIQQALATLCRGRTVLMIAHRLRTVMHADTIVVMQHGRIQALGRHADLLLESALYQRLWFDHEQAHDWSLTATRASTGLGADA